MDFEELSRNEEFKSKLENAQSVSELVEILREYGIETTEEELEAAYAAQEGELSEENLEDVAGGCIWFPRLPFPIPFPRPIPRPMPIPRFPRKKRH